MCVQWGALPPGRYNQNWSLLRLDTEQSRVCGFEQCAISINVLICAPPHGWWWVLFDFTRFPKVLCTLLWCVCVYCVQGVNWLHLEFVLENDTSHTQRLSFTALAAMKQHIDIIHTTCRGGSPPPLAKPMHIWPRSVNPTRSSSFYGSNTCEDYTSSLIIVHREYIYSTCIVMFAVQTHIHHMIHWRQQFNELARV